MSPQNLSLPANSRPALHVAALLLVLITLIAWQSDALAWPLARISTSSGILLVSILTKLTDWALLGVTDQAWLRLQWGRFWRRVGIS